MATAMVAKAVAQLVIAGYAFVVGSVWGLPALIGFFAAMWLLSAALFRKAAREQPIAG